MQRISDKVKWVKEVDVSTFGKKIFHSQRYDSCEILSVQKDEIPNHSFWEGVFNSEPEFTPFGEPFLTCFGASRTYVYRYKAGL